jgi:hypothetical protein
MEGSLVAYKVFTNGSVLNASEVNDNLMNQAVITFSNSTARGSAIASPVEGMITYLEDTQTYESWDGTAWVGLVPQSGNAIINGAFDIWQRGTSFANFADGAFTADRWVNFRNGTEATATISRQTHSPGSAPAGSNNPFYLRYEVTNAGSSNTYRYLDSRIEDVRTFADQTVTLSFYAKADSSRTMEAFVIQNFGVDGSADAGPLSQTFSVTTSWQRFTASFILPSISGKTVGTGSFLILRLGFPAGVIMTTDIDQIQLEAGSTATPFKRNANSLQGELAACQRYFEAVESFNVSGTAQSTSLGMFNCYLKVRKRTNPTIAFTSTTYAFDRTGIDSKTGTGQNAQIAATDLCVWNVTGSSGLTIGNHLVWNGGNVEFSSEL